VAGIASLIALWASTRGSRAKPPTEALAERGASLEMIVRQTVVRDPIGAAVAALAAGLVLSSIPELSRLAQRLIGQRRS
jgi:hypothetical protein